MTNRSLLLAAVVSCLVWTPALSQEYPERPVRLVVGYPAGGAADVFARGLAEHLQTRLKQPFVVENRAGASETVAATHVSKSSPDGYTLLMSTEGPLTQNQFLYRKLAYSPESDFTPISLLARVPMLMVASPGFPAKDAKEFAAVARSRGSNPVNFASGGLGGVTHLPVAMLAKNEGFSFTHIPYGGIPPVIPDLRSGRVDALIAATSVLLPFVKDNVIKALAVQSEARLRALPNVPTFKELGIKDIKAEFVFGLLGPAKMPAPIVEKLAGAAKDIMASADFRAKYLDPFSIFPIGGQPAEFAAFLVTDREYQRERVKLSGATLD